MTSRSKSRRGRVIAKKVKPRVSTGMHYSVMIALVISNITSLGLAFLMAQFLGVSMGNIAYIGEMQSLQHASAQTTSNFAGTGTSFGNDYVGLPQPSLTCEARWAVCSQSCDDQYADDLLTKGGWTRCERDCDLKVTLCDRTGVWSEDIKVRDTKFRP